MAEMGLGYGSEFQLMRFLGHHRITLNGLIRKATKANGIIEWLDYRFLSRKTSVSGDGEWKGISCFSKLKNYKEIRAEWKKFWPQRGKAMNWDAIFKISDTWYFVEAKAHKEESFQICSATSDESIAQIKRAFTETQKWLGVKNPTNWIDSNCYQLANRLAFMCFCERNGIKAKLLYIGFVNGYKGIEDEVHSERQWLEIWDEEINVLGLNHEDVMQYLYFVHPDCDPKRKK